MKKISFAAVAVTVALGFSACSETWDDNPVLNTHEGQLKADFLNVPQMQGGQVMITESNKTANFNLTCSQPDFGYAASAAYVVQLSLTEDFANYEEIRQRYYDCAQINPLYSDVASSLEKLSGVRSEADLPLPYQKVYVRLRAFIPQSEENTQYLSNVVWYDAISADYLAIWVAGVPVNLWVRGDMNGWAGPDFDDKATTPAEWQFVTGEAEDSWTIKNVTIEPDQGFKIADNQWANVNLGSDGDENSVVTPGVSFALKNDGGSGNLKVTSTFHGDMTVTMQEGNYYLMLTPAE